MRLRLFLPIAILLFVACKEDQETIYSVPEEFQSVVDTFVAEAALHNVDVDITDNLIIEYGSTSESVLCGSCVFIGEQRRIQIEASPCWSDEITQEAFLFHMLGHCVLSRIDHDDASLPNGDPKSLMVSDVINHYACIFDLGGNNECNNLFKREYYLDELFDPETETPDWAL